MKLALFLPLIIALNSPKSFGDIVPHFLYIGHDLEIPENTINNPSVVNNTFAFNSSENLF